MMQGRFRNPHASSSSKQRRSLPFTDAFVDGRRSTKSSSKIARRHVSIGDFGPSQSFSVQVCSVMEQRLTVKAKKLKLSRRTRKWGYRKKKTDEIHPHPQQSAVEWTRKVHSFTARSTDSDNLAQSSEQPTNRLSQCLNASSFSSSLLGFSVFSKFFSRSRNQHESLPCSLFRITKRRRRGVQQQQVNDFYLHQNHP